MRRSPDPKKTGAAVSSDWSWPWGQSQSKSASRQNGRRRNLAVTGTLRCNFDRVLGISMRNTDRVDG